MGGGGGTPLGPLLGPRPPMINNILGSDYQDYADVSIFSNFFCVFVFIWSYHMVIFNSLGSDYKDYIELIRNMIMHKSMIGTSTPLMTINVFLSG